MGIDQEAKKAANDALLVEEQPMRKTKAA